MLLCGFIFMLWGIGVLFPTALLLITPNHFRGQITALSFFVGNLIGMGFGPVAVALLTDYVFQDRLAVGYSMASVTLLSLLAAFLVLKTGAVYYSDRITNV